MLFIKKQTSLDNRVGRFAIVLFFAVFFYFLFGIVADIRNFLE